MDAPTTPFKGLAPFGASDLDALLFFGRERERTLIVANVLASRLTVLYGPSGVGKSSLLQAGVAHRLRQDVGPGGKPEHAVVVFNSWTTEPLAGLRAAILEELRLDDPGGELLDVLRLGTARRDVDVLLILDGLEEYFLYHGDESGPGSLAETLSMLVTEPRLRVSVLLATRDDALSQLDRFKARIPGLFSNYLRLDQLDRAAARTAILGPIERYNRLADDHVEIEPELVEAVLDQTGVGRVDLGTGGTGRVDDQRDASRIEAPYLQLVLRRLWEEERAEGSDTLRLSTLDRLGGAEAIVRTHLERALADFDPRERDLAAAIFRHLVTPSGAKIAHAVDDLAGYADVDPTELSPVVTRLVEERILRPIAAGGNGTDAVPHEIFHDVLGDAVLSWRQRHETERSVERARSRHRRALALMSVAFVALVVVTAIAIFAVYQRSQARSAAHVAQARELAARALIQLDVDPQQSLAWALEAARLEPGRRTESVLRRALVDARLRRVLHVGSPVTVVGYSPDGARLLIGKQNGGVDLSAKGGGGRSNALYAGSGPVKVATFDKTGKRVLVAAGNRAVLLDPVVGQIRATITHRDIVTDAAFSPDGRRIATASLDGTVRVSNARDGKPLFVLETGPASRVEFSPDGQTVAAIAADRPKAKLFARLYFGNRLIGVLPYVGITDLAFSPDGKVLATASRDGTAQIWDAASGVRLHWLNDAGGPLTSIVFSPDGKFLATGSSDGAARVWRVPTGGRFFFFVGHTGGVTKVAFDPTGTFLVSTSLDHTARVWQLNGVEQGTLVALLSGHADAVQSAVFNPKRSVLATGGLDGTARIWDAHFTQTLHVAVQADQPVTGVVVTTKGDLVYGVGDFVKVRRRGRIVGSFAIGGGVFALSPSGLVASAKRDGTVEIRRVPSGAVAVTLRVDAPVAALAFNGDASELATTDGKGGVVIWGVRTGRAVHRFATTRAPVRIALAPHGDVVATGSENGVVRLWATDGKLLHVLTGNGDRITDLRFNSDGSRLVSASQGSARNAIMWNASSGSRLHALVGHFGTVTAASFSFDDRWILTAGPISAVPWPTDTGRRLFYLRGPSATDLLTDAEWVPGGYNVVTSGVDGTVRTYDCEVCVPLDRLVALATARVAAAR